ncbi:hypothetical protein IQ260_08575 [Leptolyngbya cf. ectocarpi LEGE 11479]|uniref:Uncharacterized protein n=1 Tax=Leptolyngbya cf. ectocarpi LEGE 11479 TaxID=1828722 RepID=A0A928X099_LEPEC|nr:hypothetical protein [Leptolyngbya ectocarpi]MBE9066705.1 hypothetical protein [Leptolyngbya cf. ectocarpi LEGE 11479]
MDSNRSAQPLTTEFVRMTVELQTGVALRDRIETQLRSHGDPLRWAITAVTGSVAHVEAVVTFVAPRVQNQP